VRRRTAVGLWLSDHRLDGRELLQRRCRLTDSKLHEANRQRAAAEALFAASRLEGTESAEQIW
jgi:hypothetical protein